MGRGSNLFKLLFFMVVIFSAKSYAENGHMLLKGVEERFCAGGMLDCQSSVESDFEMIEAFHDNHPIFIGEYCYTESTEFIVENYFSINRYYEVGKKINGNCEQRLRYSIYSGDVYQVNVFIVDFSVLKVIFENKENLENNKAIFSGCIEKGNYGDYFKGDVDIEVSVVHVKIEKNKFISLDFMINKKSSDMIYTVSYKLDDGRWSC